MYQNILHATDLSETHFTWCQSAVALAKKLDARLNIIHVIEAPASLQIAQGLGFAEIDVPVKEDADLVMRTLGEALHLPASQLFVEIGSITQCLLDKIVQLNCDLLVIGSHSKGAMATFSANTARDLIEHARIDVLTLHAQHL